MYTSGVWIAKKGHEDEFARLWQAAVDQLSLEFPGITFRLLRDVENPRRFVSIGGAWRNAEQIAAARALPSYQESMAALENVLESGDVGTFELTAEVS
ncbi:MAG TPA: antibiotic biosynthesis monooxygenase family protein [Gaiellaceae bacterium]|nr:antibiotic biosynthesis monooxygenase family protein [Gaiellaceae bacterium]